MLDEVVLTLDELEALRLADLEGLYHDRAAERMGISRTTFGRILSEARKKVADALVGGKVLGIGTTAVAGHLVLRLSHVRPQMGTALADPE